jgi:peptidoglycan/xylan/chitin deacetylase (PgdA/CDA1 family)
MKALLFKILRFSGLPLLFRELMQRRRVTILLFHDISRATAEKTFDCLSKRYHLLDLQTFIRACQATAAEAPEPLPRIRDAFRPPRPEAKAEKSEECPTALSLLLFPLFFLLLPKSMLRTLPPSRSLPPKSLIVTFDDGHIGNYDLLPVLQAKKIPVTIFLCAGIVGTRRHFWFQHKPPNHRSFSLRRMPHQERLRILAKAGFTHETEYETPHVLTRNQIQEMKPWVDFQSHTLFHPCLPRCSAAEARDEILRSREVLRREYGLEVNTISYPHGDYSERDIELCRQAGYECGMTVDCGFNTVDSDLLRLKRLPVNDTDDMNELIVKASGLWEFVKAALGRNREFGWTDQVEE